MTAKQAIEQSIRENRVVDVGWDRELVNDLLAACDDSADCGGGIYEFWAVTDDGDEWRVLVTVEEGGGL